MAVSWNRGVILGTMVGAMAGVISMGFAWNTHYGANRFFFWPESWASLLVWGQTAVFLIAIFAGPALAGSFLAARWFRRGAAVPLVGGLAAGWLSGWLIGTLLAGLNDAIR